MKSFQNTRIKKTSLNYRKSLDSQRQDRRESQCNIKLRRSRAMDHSKLATARRLGQESGNFLKNELRMSFSSKSDGTVPNPLLRRTSDFNQK